jgi:hypothetical protein
MNEKGPISLRPSLEKHEIKKMKNTRYPGKLFSLAALINGCSGCCGIFLI